MLNKAGFDPGQPRAPAGTGEGGQWASDGRRLRALSPADEKSLRGAIKARLATAPVTNETVPISALVSNQKEVTARGVNMYVADIKEGYDWERPTVYRHGGKLIVDDGHHRIIAAVRSGKSHVDVEVTDLDAAAKAYDPNQPRKPKGDPDGGKWTSAGGSGSQGSAELKRHLEMTSGMGDPLAKFLLEHGRAYQVDDKTFIGGKAHMCYMNSALESMSNKSVTYVEGYVSVHGVPIHHAWTVDKAGKVRDVTINDTSGIRGYFGVPVKSEWLMKSLLKRKKYGVLVHENWGRVLAAKPGDIVAKREEVMDKAYDPNQPRNPKGDSEGGQWVSEGGQGEWTFSQAGEIIAFHGTSRDRAKKIRVEGLKPMAGERLYSGHSLYRGDRGKSVFLTSSRESAQDWAEVGHGDAAEVLELRISPSDKRLRRDDVGEARYRGIITPDRIVSSTRRRRKIDKRAEADDVLL